MQLWSSPGLSVHLVSDGLCRMDGGTMFGVVPKVLWERAIPADEHNTIPMALNCLVVQDGETLLVVDTGFGDKLTARERGFWALPDERPGLVGALADLGIAPGDVDLLVNTHLHGDHAGGNTRWAQGSGVDRLAEPTFPRARYVVQRQEWADAAVPNVRTRATYLPENLAPLEDRLWLLDGDTRLSPHLRAQVTRGHTAGHQSLIVEPPGAPPIVFLGDVAPRPVHLERVAWVPAVDVLPLDSLVTKAGVARWLVEAGALVVLDHEPDVPLGRLEIGEEGRFAWRPVAAAGSRLGIPSEGRLR
jgi:glyoxylase-like metal-dependent hydrolase (beta-lactamase superfamily II)